MADTPSYPVVFAVIARIVNAEGETVGFRVVNVNEDKQQPKQERQAQEGTEKQPKKLSALTVYTADLKSIYNLFAQLVPFVNIVLTKDRKIKGKGGDLSRYTAIDDKSGAVLGEQPAVVILSKLSNGGYKICDHNGRLLRAKSREIAERCQIANGKVCVSEKGEKYISAIEGEYELEDMPRPKIRAKQPKKPEPATPTGILPEGKKIEDPVKIPPPPPTYEITRAPYSNPSLYSLRESYKGDVDLSQIKDTNNPNITLEEKLQRARITLKSWSLFHYTLYSRMQRVVSTQIPTMAVNTKEFIINPDFLGKLKEGELMFVIYHELGHIFYGHTARRGDRDPELWNVAADLLVNKAFADQFNIKPGGKASVPSNAPIKEVIMLNNCLYDEDFDPKKMSVEEVYNKLKELGKHSQEHSDTYIAGTLGGKVQNRAFKDTTEGTVDDYKFDYRLGAEAAFADASKGYTLQKAYLQGYSDANRGRPKADTSKFAPAEQDVYDKAYTQATNGEAYSFEELFYDSWGAFWRGTNGFEAGYKATVNSLIDAYRNLEDGVAK